MEPTVEMRNSGSPKQRPDPLPAPRWDPATARDVDVVLAVEGTLVLTSPAALGGGGPERAIDLPLDRDPVTGRVRIHGSRVAGPIRHALRERELGNPEQPAATYHEAPGSTYAALLCGGEPRDAKGLPSALVPETTLATKAEAEWRVQTAVDGKTSGFEKGSLRAQELCAAGTRFPLCWTVEVGPDTDPSRVEGVLDARSALAQDLAAGPSEEALADGTARQIDAVERAMRRALAAALQEIGQGRVRVGGRTTRGYGYARLPDLTIYRFDLRTADGLEGWLRYGHDDASTLPAACRLVTGDIETVLDTLIVDEELPDRRSWIRMETEFAVHGSLMIAEPAPPDSDVDRRHLRARHGAGGKVVPVTPGTSWAGALRARLQRLANGGIAEPEAHRQVFGYVDEPKENDPVRPHAGRARRSRIEIEETEVTNGEAGLVVQRTALDRFTQGTVQGRLFAEQPILSYPPANPAAPGGETARVCLRVRVHRAEDADVGDLLRLLADAWHCDLGLGSGWGRGRLAGIKAEIEVHPAATIDNTPSALSGPPACWKLEAQPGGRVKITVRVDDQGWRAATAADVERLRDYLRAARRPARKGDST